MILFTHTHVNTRGVVFEKVECGEGAIEGRRTGWCQGKE